MVAAVGARTLTVALVVAALGALAVSARAATGENEVKDPVPLLEHYLEHRLEREDQIVKVLRAGRAGTDAIVAAVYRGLKPSLLPMAHDGVVAHLTKLEREGRAGRTDEVWHIIEP